MDYAMLAVHKLRSTSDQQDALLYASIAAAAPTAVVDEQSVFWVYPQISLTIINTLLGRGSLERLP
jgi:alpha-galactosidase